MRNQNGNNPLSLRKRCAFVVFNIHGNHYRLIVDIEFRLQIVFVIWFGSHEEYDRIDARKVSYDRTNQK
ncbi:type II toxin-antitoxin system HigB family toxin [Dyadobacter sp. OTU695]|uniref:type II toxin-antitoxin system HigB family toxin n=1 Tax=Dyadobacter sp. OTU695 TaxID=3043860 RepID=UPI00313AADA1